VHGHGHRVAAGFAQRGRGDLDDPEEQGDLGDLAQGVSGGVVHADYILLSKSHMAPGQLSVRQA